MSPLTEGTRVYICESQAWSKGFCGFDMGRWEEDLKALEDAATVGTVSRWMTRL